MIKYLVFDVDNTLIDFDMSLLRAEKAIADRFGFQLSEDYFTEAAEMINAAWSEHRMSNTADPDIQDEWHRRYRGFLLHHSGLGCAPAECLMIGDSVSDDMKGARSAGLHTCWYRRGKGGVECEYADHHIDSIAELPELLEGMTNIYERGV